MDRTFSYSRQHLDRFVADVVEALWQEIDRDTRGGAEAEAHEEGHAEEKQLASLVARHVRDFVGRESLLRQMLDAAGGTQSGIASIVGPSGCGKSALFAKLVSELPTLPSRLVLAHSAGMGPDAKKVDGMVRRFVRILARDGLDEDVFLDDSSTPDEVDATFGELLARVSATRRVALLVDSLDGFEDTPRARYLAWLPARLGDRTLVITTSRHCTSVEFIESRTRVPSLELELLTRDEATHLMDNVCKRNHRQMEERTRHRLLDIVRADGQPAHGNAFWSRTATELLNLASADAFRSAATYGADPEEGLRQVLLRMVQSLPSEPAEIVTTFLGYLEDHYGAERVRDVALVLAVGRWGWRAAHGQRWTSLTCAAGSARS